MLKNYFTFGCGHPLANHYIEIQVETDSESVAHEQARAFMFRWFGRHWAFQYGEDEYADACARFNLTKAGHVDAIFEYQFIKEETKDGED